MNLQLITLQGVKIDEPVYEVVLPTTSGEIAVFPGHEPLVTVAKTGVIRVRTHKQHSDAQMELFAISGGVIEISGERVRVLVDEAAHGDDIIEAESKEALERARVGGHTAVVAILALMAPATQCREITQRAIDAAPASAARTTA